MPRRLSPDVLLSIALDAICSRNRYTSDPAPVIAELYATAGDRLDILTESVGTWVGFFEDAETLNLCTALRELPGLEPWIAIGANRRAQPDHRTPTAHAGASWPEQRITSYQRDESAYRGRPAADMVAAMSFAGGASRSRGR